MSRPPPHYDPKKHPYWKSYPDCPDQFMDPILNRSIGFWDSTHGMVFFYDLGYCFKNPKNEYDCAFYFNPNDKPYPVNSDDGN